METKRELAEKLALEVFDNCNAYDFDYYVENKEDIISFFEWLNEDFLIHAYKLFEIAFDLCYEFDVDWLA